MRVKQSHWRVQIRSLSTLKCRVDTGAKSLVASSRDCALRVGGGGGRTWETRRRWANRLYPEGQHRNGESWPCDRTSSPPLTSIPVTPAAPPAGTPLALKQLPKQSTSLRGFLYEFCVGLSLGTHPAIVAAYGIGIESASSYSFLTEPVLHGDLITLIQPKVRRPVLGMPSRAFPAFTGAPKAWTAGIMSTVLDPL